MSPEQVRGMAADHRADIFAFGAVLYEMLSGRRAFHGDTAMDALTAIVKDHPPDLPVAERRIPPALVRIADRCLEKSPAARFQSTRDLAFALESLTTPSGTSSVVAPIDGPSTTSVLWGRRAAMAWASAAGVLLLVTVALAIGYLSRAPVAPRAVWFQIEEPRDVTFAGGPAFSPGAAISPDGRHVAFMARRTGDTADLLWIRSLDALDARPLSGTDGVTFPFWSPDSTAIAFFAQGKLRKIDVSGGPAQTLCDAPAGQGGTWNRDGVILFAPNATGVLSLRRVVSLERSPSCLQRTRTDRTSGRISCRTVDISYSCLSQATSCTRARSIPGRSSGSSIPTRARCMRPAI
jgi:hypothetical protein